VAERLWLRKTVDVSRQAPLCSLILRLNDDAVTAITVQFRICFRKRGDAVRSKRRLVA
jgi:hypothetical protein